jgi:SAM-dependent methyltransferase
MLSEQVRESLPNLGRLDIVELDPNSPLRALLSAGRSYTRTFFSPGERRGRNRADGARMEDITKLTFESRSVDLLISSEVLEHVSNLESAFSEIARVLRPDGVFIFTVPPHERTQRLAEMKDGKVRQLVHPPEYHGDPLKSRGILTFWHLGRDLNIRFSSSGLSFAIVKGPEGNDHRIVWEARHRDAA